MKVGRISYLNVFPFYHGLSEETWGPWIEAPPRQLGELARNGKVDAGPLPLVDTFDLEADFEPLGRLGIACRGAVGSVLLFSVRPFQKLSGARLLFTRESATSVALAQQLLAGAGLHDVKIEYGDEPEGYDGYLAIGDRALTLHRLRRYACCTDLSQRWFEETGLPFVFARWVVRRTVPEATRRRLETDLLASLALPLPTELPQPAEMTSEQAAAYLANIIYRLDDDCLRAVEQFRQGSHVVA